MYTANLKNDCLRGHYTDKYGIVHYAPTWDLSILKYAYSKHKLIHNIKFKDFCEIINTVTNKYYFVFMCCYPKLSDIELLDMVIREASKEFDASTC